MFSDNRVRCSCQSVVLLRQTKVCLIEAVEVDVPAKADPRQDFTFGASKAERFRARTVKSQRSIEDTRLSAFTYHQTESVRQYRQHAPRNLRHQELHRDLPPQGCFLYVSPESSGRKWIGERAWIQVEILVLRVSEIHAWMKVSEWRNWRSNCEHLADYMVFYSCAREEERRQADQVQGPRQPRPLHPCPQGQRQGREAQAVSSSQYEALYPATWTSESTARSVADK